MMDARLWAEAETAALGAELSGLDFSKVRTAFDLGSRDGFVALSLRKMFPNARVFAFECNPLGLIQCRKNLSGHDVALVEKAVCDRTGFVDFYAIDPVLTVTPHADGNIGASSLFQANPEYPHEKYVQNRITVPATTLADWAKESAVCSAEIIWMDLQGAELAALIGMGDELLSTAKAIHTEVEYRPIYHGQPLAPEVDAFLMQRGFVLHKVLYRDEWMANVLYVRRPG